MTDEQGFADRMNSLPKYVVSTTLSEVTWNNSRLIKENVVEEISRLKQQPGLDHLVAGNVRGMRIMFPIRTPCKGKMGDVLPGQRRQVAMEKAQR